MNDVDEFIEILVALYVVVVGLLVLLTRLESTLHDDQTWPGYQRSGRAPSAADSALREYRPRYDIDG